MPSRSRRRKSHSGDIFEDGSHNDETWPSARTNGVDSPRVRGPNHSGARGSRDGGGESSNLLVDNPTKYKSMRTRVYSGTWMMLGFAAVLYMGHVYIFLMVVVIQLMMARELFNLARAAQREREMPYSRWLNWHFFFTGMVFVYGRFLNKQLTDTVSSDKTLSTMFVGFLRYHSFTCYSLYIAGVIFFVLTLRKGMYKYQFGQFAWTHMILFVVFAQSSFTVANLFEGMFWLLLPACLIIINDISAYFFGFFFGRTPLIRLSPKKTWEGFMGASVTTVIFAFVLAGILARFPWMICPRKDLSTGWLQCEPPPYFVPRECPLPPRLLALLPSWFPYSTYYLYPVQRHGLIFGLFASIIAPFGGFFASGFKRAFKIKDFGDTLAGHGGMTDRMDCQMVMAVFAFIYYQTFLAHQRISVGSLLEKILILSTDQQIELYERLGNVLYGEGLEQVTRA